MQRDDRGGFSYFAILASMRTGSNLLEEQMVNFGDLACFGEVFNPSFVSHPGRKDIFGVGLAERNGDPVRLVDRLKSEPGFNGFRLFHDHDPRVIDYVLRDKKCAKVYLKRDPIDSYASLKIARQTGQWRTTNAANIKRARVRFDEAEFHEYLLALKGFERKVFLETKRTGQTVFSLAYEELLDAEVISGLLQFMGVGEKGRPKAPRIKKQNSSHVREKFVNSDDVERYLSRISAERFEGHDFYPLKVNSRVRSFLFCENVGLVYCPVTSCLDAEIARWLGYLGGGGKAVKCGVTQAELKSWKIEHPGFRSFTILRHPVLRAYSSFVSLLENKEGSAPSGLYEYLSSEYGISMVGGARDDANSRAEFRKFLEFLKANKDGRTPFAVAQEWMSQVDILKGISQYLPPDLILREDEATQKLGQLASQFVSDVDGPDIANSELIRCVNQVHDEKIERKVRAIYGKDYDLLGFSDWS